MGLIRPGLISKYIHVLTCNAMNGGFLELIISRNEA